MIRDVIVTAVEAVQCRYHGLITVQMCMKCPYFNGYTGFRRIKCRRG